MCVSKHSDKCLAVFVFVFVFHFFPHLSSGGVSSLPVMETVTVHMKKLKLVPVCVSVEVAHSFSESVSFSAAENVFGKT